MNVTSLIGDDQSPLELTHVLGIDSEVGLQWDIDVDTLWDIDEGTSGPDGGVERGELVVPYRDNRTEVLLEDILVLSQASIGIKEENSLLLEVFTDRVVDHL